MCRLDWFVGLLSACQTGCRLTLIPNFKLHQWFPTQIELTPTLVHSSLIVKTCCSLSFFLFRIVACNAEVIMCSEIDSDRAQFDIWSRWARQPRRQAWSFNSKSVKRNSRRRFESRRWQGCKVSSVVSWITQVASFTGQVHPRTWRGPFFRAKKLSA